MFYTSNLLVGIDTELYKLYKLTQSHTQRYITQNHIQKQLYYANSYTNMPYITNIQQYPYNHSWLVIVITK